MRKRWGFGAIVAAGVLFFVAPLSAWAESPVSFGSSPIVDTVGAVSDRTADVEQAIDQLYESERMQLFVAYVDTFSDPSAAADWADTTANENGLGDNDYLLAVSTEGRTYHLSASDASPLSDEQLSEIDRNYIEPALRDNDWAGAAIGAANGLERAAAGQSLSGDSSSDDSGGAAFTWFLVIVVVAVAIVLFFVIRRRKKQPVGARSDEGELGALSTAELKRQAGSALVRTDDAIKTSEEELGFAIASYGSETTKGFQSALSDAKALLSAAFTLQQKLDDSTPDTEEQQRSWYAQIIKSCDDANGVLDEQAAAFDELRALEKNAPQAVATARERASTQQARLDGARATLDSLRSRYTDSSVATIADNPEQAASRLSFAAQELNAAEVAIAATKHSEAAVAIRASEEAIDQAALLFDAIDRLAADLDTAQNTISAAMADLRGDIAAARALPAGADSSGQLASIVATTEQVLADVSTKLGGERINPLEVVQRLEQANSQIDAVLGGVRDAQAAAQRAQAALSQTLLSARSQVSAAEDFITARRGAVGAEARTRLAEAGRLIVQAESLSTADPAQALGQAQRANQLAREAISIAQNDVGGFSSQNGGLGGLGGMLGGSGSSRGSSSGDLLGAVLGGILINSTMGGGSRGGGLFGGSSGGSSRSSQSGGSRRSPGSFGGSGTRSRRGSGGRF